MSAGAPIIAIANRNSDLADLIIDYKMGEVVEPHQPLQLANTIEKMLRQPQKLEELGKNSRNTAVEHFSRSRGVHNILTILEERLS